MKSIANAVRAKKVRACDNCSKKRAHWYCAADDAFLCQSCDTSVHSANALARRHERVRLKNNTSPLQEAATWHHWSTRKPRTPRGSGRKNNSSTFHGLVPEISAEDQTDSSEVEVQLICQVPVVDPIVVEPKIVDKDNAESCLNGFFPTDMELKAFAADVESVLGHGLDTESYTMEEEKEETKAMNVDIGISDDDRDYLPFDLNLDFDSQNAYEDDAIENVESSGECVKVKEEEEEDEQKNVLKLSLDYDVVISTWGGQGLPWTSGESPELDIDISGSPVVSMGDNGGESHQKDGCAPSKGSGDGGREARVSRYKEKRRTRLPSNKIRYEVRKLLAQKRPRMKGRFVKRASLAASAEN